MKLIKYNGICQIETRVDDKHVFNWEGGVALELDDDVAQGVMDIVARMPKQDAKDFEVVEGKSRSKAAVPVEVK